MRQSNRRQDWPWPLGSRCLCQVGAANADAKNNVLTIGIASEPFTLDPGQGVAGTDYPYLYSLFERILRFDPKTLEPRPGLAESWEFAGEDKTVFRFKLRPNLKFQDGTPVDAEAVKASLVHFKDDGRVKDLEIVKSIDVVDPLTVALTLTQPLFADHGDPGRSRRHDHLADGAQEDGQGF